MHSKTTTEDGKQMLRTIQQHNDIARDGKDELIKKRAGRERGKDGKDEVRDDEREKIEEQG